MRRSLNALETAFLTLIVSALPPGCQAIFTADRAYGRYPLLQALHALGQLYVLRCKNKGILWKEGRALFPKHFGAPWGQPVRDSRQYIVHHFNASTSFTRF
jgi:hypothetical protein